MLDHLDFEIVGIIDFWQGAESKIYIRTFADIPFSRYNDFKNRHGGIMNMSTKSQTVFAVCFGLFLAVLCKNGFGGSDIKLAGASGLMLGFMGGSVGYLIGLLCAVVFNLIYNTVKGRSNEIHNR